jgi:uncharacterized protein (TIGR02145 family)
MTKLFILLALVLGSPAIFAQAPGPKVAKKATATIPADPKASKEENGRYTDTKNGQTYETVKIGAQIWMAENLKSTKYNDGSAILNISDADKWYDTKMPAYCWYKNDINYKNEYGALYNWYAVNTGKLCPIGWHVPAKSDWKKLKAYLGENAGSKLKKIGLTHWKYGNNDANNSSGFTALPGGCCAVGEFRNMGTNGYWWSSSGFDNDASSCLILYYDHGEADQNIQDKRNGYNVRCIKDN